MPVRSVALLLVYLICAQGAQAQALSCFPEKNCRQMQNCAEAYFHFAECKQTRRDGDEDGIPCESLCGKTLEIMAARLSAQGYDPASPVMLIAPAADFSCTPRKTCGRMVSCAEAKFHLNTCGNLKLDGNKDGIPCNSICR